MLLVTDSPSLSPLPSPFPPMTLLLLLPPAAAVGDVTGLVRSFSASSDGRYRTASTTALSGVREVNGDNNHDVRDTASANAAALRASTPVAVCGDSHRPHSAPIWKHTSHVSRGSGLTASREEA